ncbi:RTC4-like domain-containing protein [Mycena haematopus]|nr:RTC4-like domain-containing protein [Mycena haematopus]
MQKGLLNEDLGSGLDLPIKPVRVPEGFVDLDSDSDDEDPLNMLPPKKSSQPKPSSQPARREKLDTDDAIKKFKLKFHRKNSTEAESRTPTSKENAKRNADRRAGIGSSRAKGNAVASSSTTRPLRDNAVTSNRSSDARIRPKPSADLTDKAGDSKCERPKPRPLVRARSPPPKLSTSPPKPKLSAASSRSSLDSSPSASGKEHKRPIPSAFPMISPLSDAKAKGKGRETDRQQRKELLVTDTDGRRVKGKEKEGSKMKRAFPDTALSPLSSPTKTKASFLPSPLGTPVSTPNRKLRLAPSNFPVPSPLRPDEQGKPPNRKLLPFPMNTQMFEGSPSCSPSKRRSPMSNDDERDRKRSKNASALLSESYDFEEDSELLFIAPGTDPKTLCPYCDTLLPAQPTPLLKRLLEETFRKSYRDVRPSNPLGRKAPMGIFVGVCQRHRFESETLPEAEARGWPKYINWADLKGRVLAMKRDLQGILADPGDPIVYGNDGGKEEKKRNDESRQNKGPRMRCIFWKDLVKELKSKGSKGVKGVQGQFANFEKTQPGYYGELGSAIIHQTLYDMFPLDTIDPDLVDPLTPNEFIQRILVPEVGMRLVMTDMDLILDDQSDKQKAVAVLRESASYGVAMFPEDGGESGGVSGKTHTGDDEEAMGVAEQIVMERARKRRKELEIEEGEEDALWQRQEDEAEEERKREKAEIAKQKRRATRKAKKAAEAEPVDIELAPATRPRPRPRPVPKAVATVDSASDMDMDSSPNSRLSDPVIDVVISSGVEELVPTPKARLRHTDQLLDISKSSDADSDFPSPLHLAVSKQRTKSKKSRSTKVLPASSESESDAARVKASSRPRSPSASLTNSKRSYRGSSVVDLCSSSEDGGGSGIREAEATPRAKRPPTLKTSSAHSATSSSFRPLDAARARAPSRGETSIRHKSTGWIASMAEDASESGTDPESVSVTSQDSHSWLLDDVSQS